MDYKSSGVDIEAGYKSVELMKEHVKKTMRPEVLGGLGGFSGAFSLAKIKEMEEPTLVSGTDGCGTKVKLAFIMDKHDTIGIDAVAMCVNDIACAGGEPLFFLDYIACVRFSCRRQFHTFSPSLYSQPLSRLSAAYHYLTLLRRFTRCKNKFTANAINRYALSVTHSADKDFLGQTVFHAPLYNTL